MAATKSSIGLSVQWITATMSTTMVLLLLGMVVFFTLTARSLSAYVSENMNFTLIMDDEQTEANIVKAQRQLEQMPFVKSAEYVSKARALREMTEELGIDPSEFEEYNPFPASIELKLRADYTNRDSIARIERLIKDRMRVEEVIYQQELVDTVNLNAGKVNAVLLLLAGVLAFISFALINNTVRLSVHSKRFLIYTMKLVGASHSFIRRPFMVSVTRMGLLSALIADALLGGVIYWLMDLEPQLVGIITRPILIAVFGAVLLAGVLTTRCCVYCSVNRYLRMKAHSLYHI